MFMGHSSITITLDRYGHQSAHEVKIVGLATRVSGQWFMTTHPYPTGESLPRVLPARDYAIWWLDRASLEANAAADTSQRLRVQVTTATGKTFKSKAARLDSLPRFAMHIPTAE